MTCSGLLGCWGYRRRKWQLFEGVYSMMCIRVDQQLERTSKDEIQ